MDWWLLYSLQSFAAAGVFVQDSTRAGETLFLMASLIVWEVATTFAAREDRIQYGEITICISGLGFGFFDLVNKPRPARERIGGYVA